MCGLWFLLFGLLVVAENAMDPCNVTKPTFEPYGPNDGFLSVMYYNSILTGTIPKHSFVLMVHPNNAPKVIEWMRVQELIYVVDAVNVLPLHSCYVHILHPFYVWKQKYKELLLMADYVQFMKHNQISFLDIWMANQPEKKTAPLNNHQ